MIKTHQLQDKCIRVEKDPTIYCLQEIPFKNKVSG